jgi:predicted amidohydrolase
MARVTAFSKYPIDACVEGVRIDASHGTAHAQPDVAGISLPMSGLLPMT